MSLLLSIDTLATSYAIKFQVVEWQWPRIKAYRGAERFVERFGLDEIMLLSVLRPGDNLPTYACDIAWSGWHPYRDSVEGTGAAYQGRPVTFFVLDPHTMRSAEWVTSRVINWTYSEDPREWLKRQVRFAAHKA
jgi:hypothetical protein